MAADFDFISRGIGGGGAMFGPSISPHPLDPSDPSSPQEMFVACDMSPVFYSPDGGASWETLPWGPGPSGLVERKGLQAKPLTQVSFSSDNLTLYAARNVVSELDVTTGDAVICQRGDVSEAWDLREWRALDLASLLPVGTLGVVNAVFGDPTRSRHLLATDGKRIFSVTWDATTLATDTLVDLYAAPNFRMAGAFFAPSGVIFAATDSAVLLYDGSSSAFKTATFPAPPAPQESIISFAGSSLNGSIRLFAVCVVGQVASSIAVPGTFKNTVTKLYYADWNAAQGTSLTWKKITLPGAMAPARPQLVAATGVDHYAYVAAHSTVDADAICSVYRVSPNPTPTATIIFALSNNNANIATGWGGASNNKPPQSLFGALQSVYKPDAGQEGFVTFSSPTGLAVAKDVATPSTRILLCDTALIHSTLDDHQNPPVWEQAYVRGSNPEGTVIQAGQYYEGTLETTVCSWIDAKSLTPDAKSQPEELRLSCNDIATIVSHDKGANWTFAKEHWERPAQFMPGSSLPGDVFQTTHFVDASGVVHEFAIRYQLDPTVNTPYSSVDALKQYNIDKWTGGLHKLVDVPDVSTGGLTTSKVWKNIKANFGSRVPGPTVRWRNQQRKVFGYSGGIPVWMAVDANDAKFPRLYVSVAHSLWGGVWYCDDPIPNISYDSTWTRIPGTGPHPFNIRVLSGGDALLVSQSGNLTDVQGNLTDWQTSGVFVFRRQIQGGVETWTKDVGSDDHNDNVLTSWTQDVVLDPYFPDQVWYACVWAVARQRVVADPNVSSGTANDPPGGLYRSFYGGRLHNGASSWEKIFPPLGTSISVTSCARHPNPDNPGLFICTRYDGLYYCDDVLDINVDGTIKAYLLEKYPFRAPTRVFFVPTDAKGVHHQVWVTSNGNGPYLVSKTSEQNTMDLDLGGGLHARISGTNLNVGLRGADSPNPDDGPFAEVHALVDQIMLGLQPDLLRASRTEELRAALLRSVIARLRSIGHEERGAPTPAFAKRRGQ